jgi:hypothetical protein
LHRAQSLWIQLLRELTKLGEIRFCCRLWTRFGRWMARQLHPQNLSILNLTIPKQSPDFCYSWLNLLKICDTTKPPQTLTKAALKSSKWLFDIQPNNQH